jgi:hypothetical protein
MRWHLTCADFERVGYWSTARCCPHCHEEIRRGMEGIEASPPQNCRGQEARSAMEVCCAFSPTAYTTPGVELLSRELFAQVLRAKRRGATSSDAAHATLPSGDGRGALPLAG